VPKGSCLKPVYTVIGCLLALASVHCPLY